MARVVRSLVGKGKGRSIGGNGGGKKGGGGGKNREKGGAPKGGKGAAKGKGFQGKCWHCDEQGHSHQTYPKWDQPKKYVQEVTGKASGLAMCITDGLCGP